MGAFSLNQHMTMEEEKKTDLEKEKSELNALIRKGVSFEVKDIQVETEKRFFGLIRRRRLVEVTRKFTIVEPTLSTLDRLSAEWIELAIDEKAMKSEDAMVVARTMAHKHSIRCARIVAIAVLGVDRLKCESKSGYPHWVEDTEKLNTLTDLFARQIKPSRLHQLAVLVNSMSNLGDFMNSIRLMSTDRTTTPIRIEENNVV